MFPGVGSSTDRASDYGSEGWGFESLQAHPLTEYSVFGNYSNITNGITSLRH